MFEVNAILLYDPIKDKLEELACLPRGAEYDSEYKCYVLSCCTTTACFEYLFGFGYKTFFYDTGMILTL